MKKKILTQVSLPLPSLLLLQSLFSLDDWGSYFSLFCRVILVHVTVFSQRVCESKGVKSKEKLRKKMESLMPFLSLFMQLSCSYNSFFI